MERKAASLGLRLPPQNPKLGGEVDEATPGEVAARLRGEYKSPGQKRWNDSVANYSTAAAGTRWFISFG